MKPGQDIAQLLLSTAFDFAAPPPADECVFFMHFKRIGNLGDYILFTGKKGTAKTKLVSASIAAALTRKHIFNFNIKLPDHKRRVMHMDTEQSKTSHYRMMQLIKSFAEIDGKPENFNTHRCRGIRPHLIKLMIEHYLTINKDCGLIVLDGMLDVVENMNDVKESKQTKEWMEQTSEKYNVLIAGVMHRGFSADKSIGHSGSFLERGAQTVLKVDKQKEGNTEYYIISTEHIREDAAPPDTAFYFNEHTKAWELFEIDTATAQTVIGSRGVRNKSAAEYDIQDHSAACRQIFNSTGHLPYGKLIQRIAEVYGTNIRYAKQDFYKHLLKEGIIFDTGDGYTNDSQAKLFVVK